VAEFFSGIIQPNYRQYLMTESHKKQIDSRQALSYQQYLAFYHSVDLSVENIKLPLTNKGPYRLKAVENHIRIYERQQA
ncbi:MAG: hydroxymethylglutaryl-CoA synthase, partial [Thiotrichales bacterium]|nr:hydroxymethylglutaryl-CoA synthase [Thiotrichales bacterium]